MIFKLKTEEAFQRNTKNMWGFFTLLKMDILTEPPTLCEF